MFQATRFLFSVQQFQKLPPDEGREVALAGRSNSGKSSGLNALAQQKQLARTSKTPGRTQMINYFQVEDQQFLVDLPGYGYAKVPDAVRRHWQTLLQRYLTERRSLQGLLLFMDVRHPLTPLDRQMLEWSRVQHLAVHCLLTKADKLKRGPANAALHQVENVFDREFPNATVQLFSATHRVGLERARETLTDWLSHR